MTKPEFAFPLITFTPLAGMLMAEGEGGGEGGGGAGRGNSTDTVKRVVSVLLKSPPSAYVKPLDTSL